MGELPPRGCVVHNQPCSLCHCPITLADNKIIAFSLSKGTIVHRFHCEITRLSLTDTSGDAVSFDIGTMAPPPA